MQRHPPSLEDDRISIPSSLSIRQVQRLMSVADEVDQKSNRKTTAMDSVPAPGVQSSYDSLVGIVDEFLRKLGAVASFNLSFSRVEQWIYIRYSRENVSIRLPALLAKVASVGRMIHRGAGVVKS